MRGAEGKEILVTIEQGARLECRAFRCCDMGVGVLVICSDARQVATLDTHSHTLDRRGS